MGASISWDQSLDSAWVQITRMFFGVRCSAAIASTVTVAAAGNAVKQAVKSKNSKNLIRMTVEVRKNARKNRKS